MRPSGLDGPSTSGKSERFSGGEGEGEGGRADVGVLDLIGDVTRLGGLEICRLSRAGGEVMLERKGVV